MRLDDEEDGKERAGIRRGLTLDLVQPFCNRPHDSDVLLHYLHISVGEAGLLHDLLLGADGDELNRIVSQHGLESYERVV